MINCFKAVLIFKGSGFVQDRAEYFFDNKHVAKKWLDFYTRTDNFTDSTGRPTPIEHSYVMRFQY